MFTVSDKGEVRGYFEITKLDKKQRMVFGYASTASKDADGEIVTIDALKGAMPDYMKFGNIREMHQLSAVGVAKSADIDEKGMYIGAKIVDNAAWEKVLEGVYKGFSIGGSSTSRDPTNSKIITGLDLIEISLVDRPANPEALIEVVKAGKLATDIVDITIDESNQDPIKKVEDKTGERILKFDPVQSWGCGIPGHAHPTKGPAIRCMKSQHEKLGKNYTASHELLQVIADAAASLDPAELVTCANAITKASEASTDIEKKDSSSEDKPDDDPMDREDPDAPKKDKEEQDKEDGKEDAAKTSKAGSVFEGTKQKADDKEAPKGDYGEDDEAGYADPGLQDDKKPRYPLKQAGKFSAERIRAAWNYINHPKNEDKYSAGSLSEIKERVIAAWKDTIDDKGPPKAAEKASTTNEDNMATSLEKLGPADAKSSLKKGLFAATCAIDLLASLDRLQKGMAGEAAKEGDGSELPGRMSELVKMMSELVKAILAEEVEEMLTGKDMGQYDGPACIMYAAPIVDIVKAMRRPRAVTETFMKAIGDRTGDPGFMALLTFADEVSKTVEQTQEWGDRANSPQVDDDKWGEHGASDDSGSGKTAADAGVDMEKKKAEIEARMKKEKAKPEDDEEDQQDNGDDESEEDKKPGDKAKKTTKAKTVAAKEVDVTDSDGLLDLLKSVAETVQDVKEEVSSIRRDPARPAAKGVVKSVSKGEDADADHTAKPVDDKDPTAVFKAIRQRPHTFQT